MAQACTTCQWSWLAVNNVTADRSHKMNCEVYGVILPAQIQPNVVKRSGPFTLQIDNNPKHMGKATFGYA